MSLQQFINYSIAFPTQLLIPSEFLHFRFGKLWFSVSTCQFFPFWVRQSPSILSSGSKNICWFQDAQFLSGYVDGSVHPQIPYMIGQKLQVVTYF